MSLYKALLERHAEGKALRVGLIGAGKFATMYISQARKVKGIHLLGVAELFPERAFQAFKRTLWPDEQVAAGTLEEAYKNGTTCVLEEARSLIASPFVDIIIEATGNPELGIEHALLCCQYKKDIVMVNVEADALAGPLLAEKAREAGIIYSLAYGDQPALICDMVDWARVNGFEVVAAGKGTKYLPDYYKSTPETIWQHYGISPEQARKGGMNPKMFNSFLDGTKSAIEMAAVSNATALLPNPEGLLFPACGADHLQDLLIPRSEGGVLHHSGQVEVISSLEVDKRPVYRDLRWGVYVVLKGDTEYVRDCFKEYGMITSSNGVYTSLYRPYHMIGLELNTTVAAIGIRREATGTAEAFYADVAATMKRAAGAGEILDGEGGYYVYGKLMAAQDSIKRNAIPLGLCHNVKLKRAVAEGQVVSWDDVEVDDQRAAVRLRKEMEVKFA